MALLLRRATAGETSLLDAEINPVSIPTESYLNGGFLDLQKSRDLDISRSEDFSKSAETYIFHLVIRIIT